MPVKGQFCKQLCETAVEGLQLLVLVSTGGTSTSQNGILHIQTVHIFSLVSCVPFTVGPHLLFLKVELPNKSSNVFVQQTFSSSIPSLWRDSESATSIIVERTSANTSSTWNLLLVSPPEQSPNLFTATSSPSKKQTTVRGEKNQWLQVMFCCCLLRLSSCSGKKCTQGYPRNYKLDFYYLGKLLSLAWLHISLCVWVYLGFMI